MSGTPKTLLEAIENGMAIPAKGKPGPDAWVISTHVEDFLAQRFGAAMLQVPEDGIPHDAYLLRLFQAITGKPLPNR